MEVLALLPGSTQELKLARTQLLGSNGRYRDERGEVRLVTPAMTWEDYVHLVFDEIRVAGAGSPQVARRLHAALQDLLTIAPSARRSVLHEQVDLLQAGIDGAVSEESDRNHLKRGDSPRARVIETDRYATGPTAKKPHATW